MSRAYPTKNEARAYGDGYAQGGKDSRLLAQHEARALAFGAIRRAVAEARRIDRGAFYETDANVIDYREAEAALIRRTIRAAIGSDKT